MKLPVVQVMVAAAATGALIAGCATAGYYAALPDELGPDVMMAFRAARPAR